MPKKTPRLAEEGRVREDWEYVEWAARVSADAEDIRFSLDEQRWKEHVKERYRFSLDPEKAAAQMRGLWDKGMMDLWEKLPDIGVRPYRFLWRGEPVMRYWDLATKKQITFTEVAKRIGWFVR